MADLEDTILKENIPGRWSTHDRGAVSEIRNDDCEDGYCDDHVHHKTQETDQPPKSEEEQLMDLAKNLAFEDVPEPIRQSIIAQRLRNPSTGVKGVLADYKADQALRTAQRQAQKDYREAVLNRIANGAKAAPTSVFRQEADLELFDDDEDDDEFLQEFRLRRLKEMQMTTSMPSFGCVVDITSHIEYLNEVNNTDPRVNVIVHLYETSIRSCVILNRYLDSMSIKYMGIKFLRMQASALGIDIDRVAFPMISVYRAGETIQVFAGLEQELGERFTQEDVEWLLESNEIFNGVTG